MSDTGDAKPEYQQSRCRLKQIYRFRLLDAANDDNSSEIFKPLLEQFKEHLERKACIVSIIGKSCFGRSCSKADLIDDTLQRRVFQSKLGDKQSLPTVPEYLSEIEGFYDSKSNVIFLHLTSFLDTDCLLQALDSFSKDIAEQGFLNVWSRLNLTCAKSLMLLFLISHIVVISQPGIQMDTSFLQIFHLLEQMRKLIQQNVEEALANIGTRLPPEWRKQGRPCSPRVLFVFDHRFQYNNHWSAIGSQRLEQEHVRRHKRRYELHLEDQLYRILRKSRIITNICSNSLFAICNQSDFVFIVTENGRVHQSERFFDELLTFYCDDLPKSAMYEFKPPENDLAYQNYALNTSGHQASQTVRLLSSNESQKTFYEFLFSHINTAQQKGFVDNVGRHNLAPFFHLPTLQLFTRVALVLRDLFFGQTEATAGIMLDAQLSKFIEIDLEFSEACCQRVLQAALSFYKEQVQVRVYPLELHEQKFEQAYRLYSAAAKGQVKMKYAELLRKECDAFWRNGHQVCDAQSLYGNRCIQPVHELPPSLDFEQRTYIIESGNGGTRTRNHCSGVKFVSACDCGRKQINRDDPFSIGQANSEFYAFIGSKCKCRNELQRISFPIFSGELSSARAANSMLKKMMAMRMNDKDESDDEYDEDEDDEDGDATSDETGSSNAEDNIEDGQLKSQIKTVNDILLSQDFNKADAAVIDAEDLNYLGEDNIETDEDESGEEGEEEEGEEDGGCNNERSKKKAGFMNLVANKIPDDVSSSTKEVFCKTEYLSGMLNSLSPRGLLPLFSSWSLVRLGSSSIYSHDKNGISDQPGFISGTHYLLPWDVNVKFENCLSLPEYWQGRNPPGIKNRRTLSDGIEFTVKIFIGMEYECLRGHRFMSSRPGHIMRRGDRHRMGNANLIASSDLPLYLPCVCNRFKKEQLAQLMRIHVVTPKAPVQVTLTPRIRPAASPCPIYFPIKSQKDEASIKLSPASYWVLRLPFVYQVETTSTLTSIYPRTQSGGKLHAGCFGIAEFLDYKLNDR